MADQEITVAKTQVTKATTAAQELVVQDAAGLQAAADLIAKIKTVQKFVKDTSGKVLDPLRESKRQAQKAMDAEQERWEPILTDAANAERIVKDKAIAYNQKVEREAAIERERILKAQRDGEIKKETTVQKKLEAVEQVQTNVVSSKGGGMQFRKVPKLFITDKALIPLEYLEVNLVAVKAAIKAGTVVPGAEIREVDEAAGFGR